MASRAYRSQTVDNEWQIDHHHNSSLWAGDLKILLVKKVAWPTALNVEQIVCSYHVHNVWSIFLKLKATVNLTLNGLISKLIVIIYTPIQIWDKFVEPRLILCLVINQTRFGLYVNMLMVTVTLTFYRLTSKSTGIIYNPKRMSAKFEEPKSILCLVIIRTRFGLCVNMMMFTMTMTFDWLTSKSIGIIYTLYVCAKFDKPRSILCLVIIWTSSIKTPTSIKANQSIEHIVSH